MRPSSLASLLAVALWASLCLPTVGGAELLAGAAKRSIVPPHPTPMAGYFDRKDAFTGVKSPIHARALVCDNGETRVAVIALDLLCVSENLVDAAREAIQTRTGIPAGNVLIAATHTHAAPAGFYKGSLFDSPYDEVLFEFLVTQMTDAVAEAFEGRISATLGFGHGRLNTVTTNRQQHNTTAIDPDVVVLRVNNAQTKEPVAVLFNFTGHPVILNSENLDICAEYPGTAAQTVEDVLGCVALFTQGACGDVTMRRSGPEFSEVERLGRILAGEVIKTAEQIATAQDTALASSYTPVEIPPRQLPAADVAEKERDKAKAACERAKNDVNTPTHMVKRLERQLDDAEWAFRLASYVQDHPGAVDAATRGSIHVMQIGPLALVGVPGELFVEYGLEMKQRVRQMKDRPMMLVGFANNYLGYLVTPRAKATGGYEQASSRVDHSAGRDLTEAAMAIVEEIVE
jgi:Neutral/alkaline non-lysosomal ceramidase, N-terminal